jgi:hypothetical protein
VLFEDFSFYRYRFAHVGLGSSGIRPFLLSQAGLGALDVAVRC